MAPFDSELVTKISPLIEGQVPDFVQSEHPQYVKFLKAYYEFLEAAELVVDGVINNIIQETTSSNFILDEDGGKVVTESGVGTTGKFEIGETITGGTSNATATIIVDDLELEPSRLIISSNQKFIIGETVTGGNTGATATVVSYRGNPIQTIQKLLDYANSDNTTASLLDEMQRQFMSAIPFTLADGISKRDVIKSIKDLYTAKGTSEGHKLFLRMMFAEESDIFYPTRYMMRMSDGNWTKRSIIRARNKPGADGNDVIGQYLTGVTSGATVFVSNAIGFAQGADSITEFEVDLTSIVGTFVDGETLSANGVVSDVEQRFELQKIITGAIVDQGGILYSSGDDITLDSSIGNGNANAQVNTVGTGGVSDIIIDTSGSDFRVGDPLVFTTTDSAAVAPTAEVAFVGDCFILESTSAEASRGFGDYLVYEDATNNSFPDMNLIFEDGDNITLNGTGEFVTDGVDADTDWYILSEYGTPKPRVPDKFSGNKIVGEQGTAVNAETGNIVNGIIGDIRVTSSGSGYLSLPTVTVTSSKGSGENLIALSTDIGAILDVNMLDTGFNYKSSPNASVPANLIVKKVRDGTFSATNTLSSHEGTVISYTDSTQLLVVDIDDDVSIKMEQEGSTISQNVELEVNTELSFSRLVGDNVLEENSRENLQARGLDIEDAEGIIIIDGKPQRSDESPEVDTLVTDGQDSNYIGFQLETDADFQREGERFHIELQHINGEEESDLLIDPFTFATVIFPRMRQFGENILLEGTAVGDSFLIEDGGTDGSGTNAGDEILLDGTDSSGTDAGSKVIQFSVDEGNSLLYEPHNTVDHLQQRKDKFQLNGTDVQQHTAGGWLSQTYIEANSIATDNSIEVFVPEVHNSPIMLEEVGQGTGLFGKEVGNFRSASLGLNGTSGTINSAFTAFSGLTYARNRRIPERQRDELNHEAHGQIANPTKADGFGLDPNVGLGYILHEPNTLFSWEGTKPTQLGAGRSRSLIPAEAYVTTAPIDGTRIVDLEEGVLLEDGTSDRAITSLFAITLDSTASGGVDAGDNIAMEDSVGGGRLLGQSSDEKTNIKDVLLLEGIDGNSSGTDVDGLYTFFEKQTVDHGIDSASVLIGEDGFKLLDESSNDPLNNTLSSIKENVIGDGDKIIFNADVISNFDETIVMVFNATDSGGSDEGSAIIFDGLSASERVGNTLMQESGLAAGDSDTDVGDNILHEPEDFLSGNIILDATDDDGTNAGEELLNETPDNLIGQTITTTTGVSAEIISATIGKLSMSNGFVSTDVGRYQNTESLVSEDVIRIQDSYYYQDFSYEVRIGQSVANYMNQLKKAVHPSGFAAFGKVTIASLMSVSMPVTGVGLIDAPDETFTNVFASVLSGVFNLKINQRIGIPKVFESGNVFQALMLESGGEAQFNVTLDGTDFGTSLETGSSGGSSVGSGFGIIALETSKDEGDSICITGSDDGSQVDAGDQIILEGTDASGTDNVDITGAFSFLILNATSITADTGEINDAGSYCVMNGSALGVYNLIDADGDQLVLNGSETGTHNRLVHEDGDHVGSHIVTDGIVVDSRVLSLQYTIISEDANGDNIILNGTNLRADDENSLLMSEAAAGIGDLERDNLFVRQLKVKMNLPKPRPLNSVGLSHMVMDSFSDASGVTNIQLEDALRKRGPTINVDRLLIDGVDVGEKDDVNDIKYGGDPMQMEVSAALNLGSSVTFKNFYRFTNFLFLLSGTDGSSSNAGDNIELETNWGGRLISEDETIAFPMNDFLRPDIMIMEGDYYKHSEWGRLSLDGTASDGSTGALNSTGYDFIVLDGIDAMQNSAGENLLVEEINDHNKSFDDANDIAIRIEDYEGGSVLLNGTDSSSSHAGDEILEETDGDKLKQEDYGMEAGDFVLENNFKVYLLLDSSDSIGTDNGTVIGLEDDSGSLLNELFDGYGQSMLLETGSATTQNSKLILDSQVIEIESGINDGEIPTANWGENSVFPSYTVPSDISSRPVGRVSLQDERAITEIVLDGTNGSAANAGDNIIFDRTTSDNDDLGDKLMAEEGAEVILDQSAGGLLIQEGGDILYFENGTHSSLLGIAPAFLPLGFDAESFDNVSRTSFDNTKQTLDVLEGF